LALNANHEALQAIIANMDAGHLQPDELLCLFTCNSNGWV